MTDAERERIEAELFEYVAQRLENLAGSEVYKFAFRKAARMVREMKPEYVKIKEICKDTTSQISASSSQLGSPSGRLVPGG
jgi:hypothetical protein